MKKEVYNGIAMLAAIIYLCIFTWEFLVKPLTWCSTLTPSVPT